MPDENIHTVTELSADQRDVTCLVEALIFDFDHEPGRVKSSMPEARPTRYGSAV